MGEGTGARSGSPRAASEPVLGKHMVRVLQLSAVAAEAVAGCRSAAEAAPHRAAPSSHPQRKPSASRHHLLVGGPTNEPMPGGNLHIYPYQEGCEVGGKKPSVCLEKTRGGCSACKELAGLGRNSFSRAQRCPPTAHPLLAPRSDPLRLQQVKRKAPSQHLPGRCTPLAALPGVSGSH